MGNAWDATCGPHAYGCSQTDPRTGARTELPVFAMQTRMHGHWSNPVVWCPTRSQPAVTLAAVREQVLRLLPHVAIGSAWTHTTLVNTQLILWAHTGTERDLGTVTIVGKPVRLRIGLEHAYWDFGDATTDTATDPGKAYDQAGDPCRTAQCPHYYGHTYRHTGTDTIALTLTWRAQFRVDAGTWTDLDAPVTGPTAHHHITVKQARGILVPNPGD